MVRCIIVSRDYISIAGIIMSRAGDTLHVTDTIIVPQHKGYQRGVLLHDFSHLGQETYALEPDSFKQEGQHKGCYAIFNMCYCMIILECYRLSLYLWSIASDLQILPRTLTS